MVIQTSGFDETMSYNQRRYPAAVTGWAPERSVTEKVGKCERYRKNRDDPERSAVLGDPANNGMNVKSIPGYFRAGFFHAGKIFILFTTVNLIYFLSPSTFHFQTRDEFWAIKNIYNYNKSLCVDNRRLSRKSKGRVHQATILC